MVAHDQNLLGFISFSRGRHKRFEDRPWLERVQTAFAPLERRGKLTLWDDSKIDHGDEWHGKIREAMEKARVAVLLVSPDYLASDFCMKEEFPYLVERAEAGGLILLPILVRDCDWEEERWLEAHQMKPAGARPLLELGPAEVDKELKAIVRDVTARLDTLKEHKPVATSWQLDHCDITRLPASGKELFGRKEELAWLDACWRTPTTNVVSLIAWGGVGKSALVNRWLEGMAKKDWDGADRVFGWSFYSQGSHENSAASADLFIDAALRWFGDPDPTAGSPWDKGERLADLIRKQRTLLVLDGLEPLQWASGDTGRIKDPALATLVETLADSNPGLVLITSRMHVKDMEGFEQAVVPERDLFRLTKEAGRALLRARGARGWDHELEAMSEAFGNHAFAVSLLASWLRTLDPPHLPKVEAIPDLPGVREDERPARRVIAAFAERFGEGPERQILRILGLFDRPATKGELDAILLVPLITGLTDRLDDSIVWTSSKRELLDIGLVATERQRSSGSLDAHPMVRKYFQCELEQGYPEARREGHLRLFNFLERLPKKVTPESLQDMRPLLLAVNHGCAGGQYDLVGMDILFHRIMRGESNYLYSVLGAHGEVISAASSFFDRDGMILTNNKTVITRLLNLVSISFGAMGHFDKAIETARVSADIHLDMQSFSAASINISNLGGSLLRLGRIIEAEKEIRRSIEVIDLNNDKSSGDYLRALKIAEAKLANVLHYLGRDDDARSVFEMFEVTHERDGARVDGDRRLCIQLYCEFLVDSGLVDDAINIIKLVTIGNVRDTNVERSGLFNCLLGRALMKKGVGSIDFCKPYVYKAVEQLRQSQSLDSIALSLLVRAFYRRVHHEFKGARKDLSEVRRVARRGNLRLHLIDHDLESARLAIAEGDPDAAVSLLLSARTAINETSYHRRDPEVKELEQQLGIPPLEPQQPSPTSSA